MNTVSLITLVKDAWRLSFEKRFFWYGLLVALPLASERLLSRSLEASYSRGNMLEKLMTAPLLSLALLLGAFFITSLGRSALIPILWNTMKGSSGEKEKQSTLHFLSFKNFGKTLLIESSFLLATLALILTLSLPSIISFVFFGQASNVLMSFALLFFIVLLIPLLFVREYSYCYFLLSPLRLFPAIEKSCLLLRAHFRQTLQFGMMMILFSFVFTFLVNLAMLGSVVLVPSFKTEVTTSIVSFGIALVALSWYAIFSQAIWLRLFLEQARPKNEAETITKEVLPEKIDQVPVQ